MSGVLQGFKFEHSHVDPDVWMRDAGDVWDYIVVYVDDIIIAMKESHTFFDMLQGLEIRFTMKGIGLPTYHLGANFFHDDDGTLCLGA